MTKISPLSLLIHRLFKQAPRLSLVLLGSSAWAHAQTPGVNEIHLPAAFEVAQLSPQHQTSYYSHAATQVAALDTKALGLQPYVAPAQPTQVAHYMPAPSLAFAEPPLYQVAQLSPEHTQQLRYSRDVAAVDLAQLSQPKRVRRNGLQQVAALDSNTLTDATATQVAVASHARAQQPIQLAALSPKELGFNTAFLQGAISTQDIQDLLRNSGATQGEHTLDLLVNQNRVGRRELLFTLNPATNEVEPCFTPEILQQIGVDLEKLPAPITAADTCIRIPELIPQASVRYEAARLQLHISIPQLYMNPIQRGYVDPSLWDDGVTAGFVNYNLNLRQDSYKHNRTSRTLNSSFNAGINLGPWRLRNNSYLSTGNRQSTRFKSQNTYLQRGITPLKSQLILGETYTRSPIFDSVRFLGGSLYSDDLMRPDNEQGYAPVIRGVADSDATVEVRQNGYLLYSTNVSAGPFEITDLTPSGSNGNLEVIVIEADGSRHEFTQAFSSPPLMVREGLTKYDIATGQVRLYDDVSYRPNFVSGSVLHGLTSNLSVASGLQIAEDYQQVGIGLGFNTQVGAISLDALHSRSSAEQRNDAGVLESPSKSGTMLNLRYAKYIPDTGTSVSLNFKRSLNEHYRSLNNHVNLNEQNNSSSYWWGGSRTNSTVKQRIDANVSQALLGGSFYLNGSYGKNWDNSNQRSFSIGYSNNIGRINYSLSYSNSRNLTGDTGYWERTRINNQTLMLNINVPLGRSDNYMAPYLNSSVMRQEGKYSVRVGASGSFDNGYDMGYSVAVNRDQNNDYSYSGSLSGRSSIAVMNLNLSQSKNYTSASFVGNGSIVVHAGGINLGHTVGETFALAKVTPRIEGVNIPTHAGVTTGYNGYAIVPHATPYRGSWIGINPHGASRQVDFDNTMQQVIPTRGAAVVAEFQGETGRRALFTLVMPDGSRPPFGASVSNAQGKSLGLTDPRGASPVDAP